MKDKKPKPEYLGSGMAYDSARKVEKEKKRKKKRLDDIMDQMGNDAHNRSGKYD